MWLQGLRKKLKRAGIRVEVLDHALIDALSAGEYVSAARLVLCAAVINEQQENEREYV